jgi:NAD(P)-dependent dehydrogenase (short-subunit alcohol dehydrogenase family)
MSNIVITGGSAGIGAALVRRLADDDHRVVFTFCRHKDDAERLAQETGAQAVHYDQSSVASVAALTERIRNGSFAALVNNAAAPVPRQLLLKTDVEMFLDYQRTALRGVFELSNAFAAQARERGTPGAIVNVLSGVTLGMPPPKQGSYVTSKHGLLGLTRSMAVEFVRYGVRVNAVSPGMTRTSFNADLPERFVEQLEATLPMTRLATPQEVAATIRFLISADAGYINGANVPISGGQTC